MNTKDFLKTLFKEQQILTLLKNQDFKIISNNNYMLTLSSNNENKTWQIDMAEYLHNWSISPEEAAEMIKVRITITPRSNSAIGLVCPIETFFSSETLSVCAANVTSETYLRTESRNIITPRSNAANTFYSGLVFFILILSYYFSKNNVARSFKTWANPKKLNALFADQSGSKNLFTSTGPSSQENADPIPEGSVEHTNAQNQPAIVSPSITSDTPIEPSDHKGAASETEGYLDDSNSCWTFPIISGLYHYGPMFNLIKALLEDIIQLCSAIKQFVKPSSDNQPGNIENIKKDSEYFTFFRSKTDPEGSRHVRLLGLECLELSCFSKPAN
jgi:hypothetical protein